MAKFYTVDKEINGTKYVCQFSGISTALKAVDNSYVEGTSNTSVEKLAEYLFEHVVVEPRGLTVDDFESVEEFSKVVAFAREVMQGAIKPTEENKEKAK